ncbi:hypothetical protein B0O99DRAFT_340372 [Bisporella sp. PMI_857]|nr:hypothetical protein B0O99DRAFT_340372 [Bisporella sp. PMI_857]
MRSDDLSKILITLLSLTLGIYILLGFGHLYHFLSLQHWITRRILAVGWVGCFLVSLSTLIFLILGYKGIAGGLTFYTWVSFTLSSIFAIRNPTVKLWRGIFSNSQAGGGQFPVGSEPRSMVQSAESIQEQLDPLEKDEGATFGTRKLVPTPLC